MHAPAPPPLLPLPRVFTSGRLRKVFAESVLARIASLAGARRFLSDREVLTDRGTSLHSAHLLLEGYMFAVIESEERRFIVGIYCPGDFVDLHGFALKRLDHALVAAGPVGLAPVSHAELQTLTEHDPEAARALWYATLLDAAINRQWIRNLEALDAPQRIAHLFAELQHRLAMVGTNVTRTVRTPFTQTDLADMCGVSAIHANRAIARLRDLGLGEIRRGTLYTEKWAELRAFCGFDPAYLDFAA